MVQLGDDGVRKICWNKEEVISISPTKIPINKISPKDHSLDLNLSLYLYCHEGYFHHRLCTHYLWDMTEFHKVKRRKEDYIKLFNDNYIRFLEEFYYNINFCERQMGIITNKIEPDWDNGEWE